MNLFGRILALGLAWLNRISATDAMDKLSELHSSAVLLYAQGQYDEARKLQEYVFEKRSSVLGDTHPLTLTALHDLAATIYAQGDLPKARRMQEKVLEVRRQVQGNNDPDTLSAMHNLAATIYAQGDLTEARRMQEKVLEVRRQVLGNNDPGTLSAMHNLATTHFSLGNRTKAQKLLKEVVKARRHRLGESNSETLNSMGSLAATLHVLGEHAESRDLREQVLKATGRELDAEHPATLTMMSNHAHALLAQGNLVEAFTLSKRVLNGRRRVLGEKHPDTMMAMFNVAFMLKRLDDLTGATDLIGELLPRLAQVSGTGPSLSVFNVVGHIAQLVEALITAGQHIPWHIHLPAISAGCITDLDLATPEQVATLKSHYITFHVAWLRLCIAHVPEDIPLALSALQGREMAGAAIAELAAANQDFPEGDPREDYVRVLNELRRISLELSAIQKGSGTYGRSEDFTSPEGNRTGPTLSTQAQRKREANLLAEFRRLRGELTRYEDAVAGLDAGFARAMGARGRNSEQLRAGLGEDEALVLLFSLPGHMQTEPVRHYACVLRRRAEAQVLELPALDEVLTACEDYHAAHRQAGLRGEWPEPLPRHDTRAAQPTPNTAALIAHLQAAFWAPLQAAFPETGQWRIATHQGLHNLPLAASNPCMPASYVPGVAFAGREWGSRPTSEVAGAVSLPTILHVDAAWNSHPIPCVEAEARLLQRSVPNLETYHGTEILDRLRQPGRIAALISTAHGYERTDADTKTKQFVVLIDADTGHYLDAPGWLRLQSRPEMVVFANCLVGRLDEPIGGEPLGPVSLQLMRGTRHVLACLAPVPDFYMPVLSGLFWNHYRKVGEPAQALDQAKAALRSGDWPEDFAEQLRAAYHPALAEAIARTVEQICRDSMELWQILKQWLLPEQFRADFFEGPQYRCRQRFKQQLRTPEARESLANAIVEHFIERRASLPDDVVDHLGTWVQVVGY